LIAGAGIGGLAAGLALRSAGWIVSIFERALLPRDIGFELLLASNAIAALKELGIAGAVLGDSVTIDSVRVNAGPSGRTRRFDLEPVPAALRPVIVSRQALHGTLLTSVGMDAITFGAEAIGFRDAGDRVVLELRDGQTFSGDILVGADGVGSVVRRRLFPHDTLRASGLVGIRGAALGMGALLDAGLAITFVRGADSGIIRGRAGLVYWFVSSRADPRTVDEADFQRLVEQYTAAFGEPLRSIVRATRDRDIRIEALGDREPTADWGRGRVTLVGDAAHPMLPHAGQGAAQALEDAVALGLALGGDGGELVPALRRYEKVRVRRTAPVVRLSRRLSRIRTTDNAAVAAVRAMAVQAMPRGILHLAKLLHPGDPHARLRP
jgi:2-polyprenyl-6-methoxyphenol hydroxylase-like FAD-dependent oxidoreductase